MAPRAPNEFYGSHRDIEDAEELIEELEYYVQSGHGNDSKEHIESKEEDLEKDVIRAFRHHLKGQARRWYYTTPKELRQNWLRLKTFFLATFPPQAPKMAEYKRTFSHELYHLTQLPNESLSDYMYRWEVLARQTQYLDTGATSVPSYLIVEACRGMNDDTTPFIRMAAESNGISFSHLRRTLLALEMSRAIGMREAEQEQRDKSRKPAKA